MQRDPRVLPSIAGKPLDVAPVGIFNPAVAICTVPIGRSAERDKRIEVPGPYDLHLRRQLVGVRQIFDAITRRIDSQHRWLPAEFRKVTHKLRGPLNSRSTTRREGIGDYE